jgi:DNA-directed RNA polymerase specialized sigma24 family protein
VSDERPSGIFTKPRAADAHREGQQVINAHRAAEALFKPKVPPRPIDALLPAADGVAPPVQPSQRKPRFLPASQATAALSEPEIAAGAPEAGEDAATGQQAIGVAAPEHRRVRVLAEYGMTYRQIANLYGITLDEVRRIVRT